MHKIVKMRQILLTVMAVYSATALMDTVDTNEFTKPLEIVGWTYG